MKEFSIICCGNSPVESPTFNVYAEDEKTALNNFVKNAVQETGYSAEHFYDNFEALEIE